MFDGFIQIEDIEGESSDKRYADWMEILDYDLNLRQSIAQTASSAGGASAERADFSVFSFSKWMDRASPQLALACAAGTHINLICIDLCRAGTDKTRFMQYRFADCMITSFTTSAENGFPVDDVSFVYGKIEWRYTRQNRQGGHGRGGAACGWDLRKNHKL